MDIWGFSVSLVTLFFDVNIPCGIFFGLFLSIVFCIFFEFFHFFKVGLVFEIRLQLKIADDLGILVNTHMETSIERVFAAGDVCTASWDSEFPHWTQIRLWTQARQMGIFSARCMLIDDILLDISLEIFAHATTFFGYKVVKKIFTKRL